MKIAAVLLGVCLAVVACTTLSAAERGRFAELVHTATTRALTADEAAELDTLRTQAASGEFSFEQLVTGLASVLASLGVVYAWRGSTTARKGAPPPSTSA